MSYRGRGQPSKREDYRDALPVFSVDTKDEAARLIQKVGLLTWVAGAPDFVFPHFDGTIEDMPRVSRWLELAYKTIRNNPLSGLVPESIGVPPHDGKTKGE